MPFVDVTANGRPVPDLYRAADEWLDTNAIVVAADEYVASWTRSRPGAALRRTTSPISSRPDLEFERQPNV